MVYEVLFLLYISYLCCMFYDIFVIYLYVYYMFFLFCFLFPYYLILNLCDNVSSLLYVQNRYNVKFLF